MPESLSAVTCGKYVRAEKPPVSTSILRRSESVKGTGRSSDSFRFRAFPTSASQWQLIAKPLLLLPEQELTAMGIVADSHCIPFSSVARFPQEGVRDTFACTKIENN